MFTGAAAARWRRAAGRSLVAAAAVGGAAAGAWVLAGHLADDPFADVRAYWEAGRRLNAGDPLYLPAADPDAAAFYRYPPLLAIAFRPLALLPLEAATAVWVAIVLASLLLTLRRIGLSGRTIVALGLLGVPLGFALGVAQAQLPVTWLVATGSPAAIALAANLKLFPGLVACYWLGRRDVRSLVRFAAWLAALAALQLVLEPEGTLSYLSFLSFSQVGISFNLSPYAISPLLWGALVAGGTIAAIRLAPGRWGWAAAVALSTLATPRLLSYFLVTLLAAIRRPDEPRR
ncbi:MAG: hypothetical protein RL338_361 [Chloroflexota bacterium]